MPWETSDRKARLPKNWPSLVAFVRKRACTPAHPTEGQCEWRLPSRKRCPRAGTDCDHIVPGDNHDPSNLQWLCHDHHSKKSAGEGGQRRWAARPKQRPIEAHPGRRA